MNKNNHLSCKTKKGTNLNKGRTKKRRGGDGGGSECNLVGRQSAVGGDCLGKPLGKRGKGGEVITGGGKGLYYTKQKSARRKKKGKTVQ